MTPEQYEMLKVKFHFYCNMQILFRDSFIFPWKLDRNILHTNKHGGKSLCMYMLDTYRHV